MANGEAINERLEFQEKMESLPLEKRTTETALMMYDLSLKFDEAMSDKKRVSMATSSITAAIIIGVVEGLKAMFVKG